MTFCTAGPEDESFSAKSVDEYVSDYLDGLVPFLPETIEVAEYHRETLQEAEWGLSFLDDIIERLDEELRLGGRL